MGDSPDLVQVPEHFLAHPVDDILRRPAAVQRGDGSSAYSARPGHVDEDARVVFADAPLLQQTLAPGRRQLGHRRPHVLAHLRGRRDRHEVGLGEVAVVVRFFLRTAGDRAAAFLVPVARLLHDPFAGLQQLPLPLGLVVDRSHERTQRVEVLDLAARAELRRPDARAPTRWRRRASSLLPSSRRSRRSRAAWRAAPRRSAWPVRPSGCRARSRSRAAARRRGCSRRASSRRRGCDPLPPDVQRLAGVFFEVRARRCRCARRRRRASRRS